MKKRRDQGFRLLHVPTQRQTSPMRRLFPMPVGMQNLVDASTINQKRKKRKKKKKVGRTASCLCLRNALHRCAVLESLIPAAFGWSSFPREPILDGPIRHVSRNVDGLRPPVRSAICRKVTHLPGPRVGTRLVSDGEAGFQHGVELAAVVVVASLPPHVVVDVHSVVVSVGEIGRRSPVDGRNGRHAVW